MFAGTLDSSWVDRSRRGWTTLTSFGLQALVVGALLCIPLLHPDALPLFRKIAAPVSLGSPNPEPVTPQRAPGGGFAGHHVLSPIILMVPPSIPTGISHVTDTETPPAIGDGVGIPGDRTGVPGGLPFSVGEGIRPAIPPAPPTITHVVRISRMSEGDLILKVQPIYPAIARMAGIEGEVLLEAVISKTGTIEKLHVVRGHPMLVPAALDAVSRWRYRPYLLNNEPVEVETQITVNFTLSRN